LEGKKNERLANIGTVNIFFFRDLRVSLIRYIFFQNSFVFTRINFFSSANPPIPKTMRQGSRYISLWGFLLLVVILLIGNTAPVDAKLKGASTVQDNMESIPMNDALPPIVNTIYNPHQRQLKKGKDPAPTPAPVETPSQVESTLTWLLTPFGGVSGFVDWAYRVINGLP
jgi:hypothetical protein